MPINKSCPTNKHVYCNLDWFIESRYIQDENKTIIYQNNVERREESRTFDCHWKSMESWLRKKTLVFCRGYTASTVFRNLQKRSLAFRERGTLYTRYPLWFPCDKLIISLPWKCSPYPLLRDALNSCVGLNPGSLHQYTVLLLSIYLSILFPW